MLPVVALTLLLAAQSQTPTSPAANPLPAQPAQTSAASPAGAVSDTTALRKVGGGVTPPRLLYKVDPSIPNAIRKNKVSGITLINLIVDAQGNPQNVRILRSLADKVDKKYRTVALLLDQHALEAVKQYHFAPAMEGDKPVPVELNIEVNFQFR